MRASPRYPEMAPETTEATASRADASSSLARYGAGGRLMKNGMTALR